MNNHTALPANPVESDVQTPWPRLPELNPATFLNVCQWPNFPSATLMRTAATAADKKAMKEFIARHNAAVLLRDQNDVPGTLAAAAKIGAEGNPFAQCEAEQLRRNASTLNIEDYHRACGAIVTVDREARQWAADWCERAAEKLWRTFDAEAKSVEDRIARMGGTLVSTAIVEGYSRDTWAPHQDPLLAGLYYDIWSLNFYYPSNFRTPAFYQGGPLGLFSDLVSEG